MNLPPKIDKSIHPSKDSNLISDQSFKKRQQRSCNYCNLFYFTLEMHSRPGRINTSKPVNINISFTINPKNVLNQTAFNQSGSRKARDHVQARSLAKASTPVQVSTERPSNLPEEIKTRRNRKRNSLDQCFLHPVRENQRSEDLKNYADTTTLRKTQTKTKRKSDFSSKRNHHKTASKVSAADNLGLRSTMLESAGFDYRRKSLKLSMNKMMKDQYSKKSLPVALTTQQTKSAQKKKVKKIKKGQSEHLIKNEETINRQQLIQKLTSLRSINNSLFRSQTEQQIPREQGRGIIVVHTDQSMQCIDEIHEAEAQNKFHALDHEVGMEERHKANQTRHLIETYIAILNEQINQNQIQNEDEGIEEEFERFRIQQDKQSEEKIIDRAKKVYEDEKDKKNRGGEHLRPFCSSEMTKQQKLINELERVRLHQLKKHEVEKWSELLNFIRESVQSGSCNTEEILQSVYGFLQKTKQDLQRQLDRPPQKQSDPERLQQFTNQFSGKRQQEEPQPEPENHSRNQFEDISSMSYRDEDYEEENEQLKLMNLQMIESALKTRYDTLMDRKERELANLEEQRQAGRLDQAEWQRQCQKVQKWTKRQTAEILQARKNLWRGYNEAKGIIEKTLKSRQFQEESAKKRGMMKCLSEDYLLKANYKKLLEAKEDKASSESSEESEEEEQEDQHEHEEHQQIHHNVEVSPEKKQSDESNQQSEEEPERQLIHDKETIELRDLGEEEDMDIIKERLLDIKQKHLPDDKVDSESDSDSLRQKAGISYEEVDNELHQSYEDQEVKILNRELGGLKKVEETQEFDERLKHLLPEDKEDIFQFIFLDLSIQLYQQPCHDNRIMDAINRHVATLKRQALKKKGVKTNLNVVKEYIKRFLGFIQRAHKDALKTLDDPVGPTAIQMLRYMHENDDEPREQEQVQTTLVVPTVVFEQFEKQLLPSIEFEPYYENDEERETKRVEFLRNILHIHNKALFDALNEYLDLLRPFGLWGKPFPWKRTPNFQHATTEQCKEDKLKKAGDKVTQFCSYVCGLLVDKEESLVGNARLSEEYLEQIKEDRLSRMLATDLMESEERWLFYDDEETEVLVQVATAVYAIMIKEASMEILNLPAFK